MKTRAEANSLIVADIILSDLETTCVEKSWAILTGDRQSADKGGMAELCEYDFFPRFTFPRPYS